VRRNGGPAVAIEAEGLGLLPMPEDQADRPEGAAVQVALRPERFALSADRPADRPAVRGRLATSAFLGERSHFFVRIEDRDAPVAVSVPNQSDLPGVTAAGPADAPIWLSWAPGSIVVLDPD
jgi:spermidine/putrescine transport system ATP-binding protein/putrescine transport system ATP-binding protein